MYQTDVYLVVNKKAPGVIDENLFIITIVVGMFYFHSLRLPWAARAEDATRMARKSL